MTDGWHSQTVRMAQTTQEMHEVDHGCVEHGRLGCSSSGMALSCPGLICVAEIHIWSDHWSRLARRHAHFIKSLGFRLLSILTFDQVDSG